MTAMARWTLRSLAGAPVPPADALRFLNDAMLREDLGGRFITIAYQLLRVVDAGRAEVTVACAGHPAPILVPKAGEPSTLPARGTLLGVWPDILLHTAEIRLSPGDSLVTYTDGVTDQGPETQLSPPLETLRDHAPPASAEQLARLLDRSAHPGASRQRDDIAILALRFTGDLDADASRLGDRELTDQTVLG